MLQCYKFQLYTEPDIALQRVVSRTKKYGGDLPEERMRRNISLFRPRSRLGFEVINTTNLNPEDVAEKILKKITG